MKYYYVYIICNQYKTVFYTGVTNNIKRRVCEHWSGRILGFSSRYKCKYLIHYEKFNEIKLAIRREKEIKKWGKLKKIKLISMYNPKWIFLNEHVFRVKDEFL